MCVPMGNTEKDHMERAAIQHLNDQIRRRDDEVERQRQADILLESFVRYLSDFSARIEARMNAAANSRIRDGAPE